MPAPRLALLVLCPGGLCRGAVLWGCAMGPGKGQQGSTGTPVAPNDYGSQ